MKKIIPLFAAFFLSSAVAFAQEEQPDIEINLDVLQQFTPPAPELAQPQIITPAMEPAKVTPYKPSVEKRQVVKKPVAKKHRTAKKHEKHKKAVTVKPMIAPELVEEAPPLAIEPMPIEQPAPIVEAPKVEEPKPAEIPAPIVETEVPAAIPAAEIPAPIVETPVQEQPAEESFQQKLTNKMNLWLGKAHALKDRGQLWFEEKTKTAAQEQSTEKPAEAEALTAPVAVPVEPIVPPAEPSAPAPVVTEETPASAAAEAPKQPEPFTIPPPEAEPQPAAAPATETPPLSKAEVEVQRLKQTLHSWLDRLKELNTKMWYWVKEKTSESESEPSPAPQPTEQPVATEPAPAPAPEVAAIPAPVVTEQTAAPTPEPIAPANDLATPVEPEHVAPSAEAAKPSDKAALYTVLFAAEEDVIATIDVQSLSALAAKLKADTNTRISILGFAPLTDGKHESEVRKLSLKRAIAVRQLLMKEGVPSARINVQALGSETPEVVKDRVDIIKLN